MQGRCVCVSRAGAGGAGGGGSSGSVASERGGALLSHTSLTPGPLSLPALPPLSPRPSPCSIAVLEDLFKQVTSAPSALEAAKDLTLSQVGWGPPLRQLLLGGGRRRWEPLHCSAACPANPLSPAAPDLGRHALFFS